jgi:phospholipid/cholesterol/gamma-HCH transport system ATP-binding protein
MVPFLKLENVFKTFGNQEVLKGVSLEVMPGETLVVLGMSGTGKSVTLQHLVGFIKPDRGRVFVEGQDITEYSEEELIAIRQKVAYVFQSNALFDSLTVFENVAFSLRNADTRYSNREIQSKVREKLDLVRLTEAVDLFPSDLSTGMKKRVAIARALAAEPQCLLYDEPTTGVDPLIAKQVTNLIKELDDRLHLTSIVVTHDMKCARKIASRVAFLHQGEIIFYGTFADMEKSEHPIVRNFLPTR